MAVAAVQGCCSESTSGTAAASTLGGGHSRPAALTRLALAQVFADADEEYADLGTVKARLATWREKYPGTFRDAYGPASAPALFAPLVRLQLLQWDPLHAQDPGAPKVSRTCSSCTAAVADLWNRMRLHDQAASLLSVPTGQHSHAMPTALLRAARVHASCQLRPSQPVPPALLPCRL